MVKRFILRNDQITKSKNGISLNTNIKAINKSSIIIIDDDMIDFFI
jgi:hypothetical protein